MRGAWRYPRLRKYRHLETEARWNRKGLHSPYAFQRLCRRESFKSSDLHGWPFHGVPSCQDRRPRRRRLWHFALSLQALVLFFINTITYYLPFFPPPCYVRLGRGTNLPRRSPYRIVLTKKEREELERRANKYTLPYFIVARAKMILLAAQGLANDEIANSLSTRREIVSRWRKRFFEKRLGGLEDFPRPGRPRVFPPRAGRAR